MKIESSEFEHERVYFKQFGAERVKRKIRAYTSTALVRRFTRFIRGCTDWRPDDPGLIPGMVIQHYLNVIVMTIPH